MFNIMCTFKIVAHVNVSKCTHIKVLPKQYTGYSHN